MWDDVLRQTDHRPWPLPPGPYAMTMTWERLLFAHWPLPADSIRPRIPPALELDTHDGLAWIGVVPFAMRNVAPRRAPRAPCLSAFLELNVRTYVTDGNKPGVFFFSLDAANPVAVAIARRWYHLPYFSARMTARRDGDRIVYDSERRHRGAPAGRFRASYRPAGPVCRPAPGSLEAWLTERYCLYAVDRRGMAYRGEVQHGPWPLQPAELEVEVNTVVAGHGLVLPETPPLLHYAERIDVLAWNPVRVEAA